MIRLLMIVGVVLCSMHLAEPASAHAVGHAVDSAAAFHLDSGTCDDHRQEPAKSAYGGHHHCPVAPDLRQMPADASALLARGLLFAAPALPLASRAPPPLLSPPLA
nr:hypothetical protein [Sphingomonas laterariae]